MPNPIPTSDKQSILEVVDREVLALRNVVETRFNAMDEAVKIFHADLTRVPTQLQVAIGGLRELLEAELRCAVNVSSARFEGLDRRFATMESRRVELKEDSQRQIDQALAAQEKLFHQQVASYNEASAKTETGFTKQMDALAERMLAADDALSARIYAVKEASDKGSGKEAQQGETRQTQSWILPLIVLTILNVSGIIVSVIIAMK